MENFGYDCDLCECIEVLDQIVDVWKVVEELVDVDQCVGVDEDQVVDCDQWVVCVGGECKVCYCVQYEYVDGDWCQ